MTVVAAFPVLCLLGPTGAGKSAAALALAQRARVEIISLDSALVYRGMDIGTAKPNLAEQAECPHHLIDIVDPTATYSVAQFRHHALALIQAIRQRGALPIVVGGTVLYYKSLIDGLSNLPMANPEVRAMLSAEADQQGWPALHARLMRYDPVTALRLHPHDAQRIQRALEVRICTGQPMSALLETPHVFPKTREYNFIPIVLEPSCRVELHERLAARFDAMLELGLVSEVIHLRTRHALHVNLPSMRCVGYRQVWAYLENKMTYQAMREQGIVATRQLVKRQLTWLRSMTERIRVDCCASDVAQQVVRIAHQCWK